MQTRTGKDGLKKMNFLFPFHLPQAGSRTTLDTFKALAPPNVDVIESGCQGK